MVLFLKNRKMKFFLPFFYLFIVGCTPLLQTNSIRTIDIEKAFNNICDIFLSDFADEIEYIQLETVKESVTGGYLHAFASDRNIIAISFRQIYLFERKSGKFIREIGRYGPGPNEYGKTTFSVPFDENRHMIRASANDPQKNIEFDLDGIVVRTLNFPTKNEKHKYTMWSEMIPLDEKYYVTYVINNSGNEPDKLLVFDEKGNVFARFTNHHTYEINPKHAGSFTTGGGIFYKRKNDVFFYENCVDTLYQVTKDEIYPYFHFHLGKYNPPYSEKSNLPWGDPDTWGENRMRDIFFEFQTINESERFLFFSFDFGKMKPIANTRPLYFGYYDKELDITKISKVDKIEISPVINDLDEFAPLYQDRWSINNSGEMVAYMEAGDIKEWFDENPEKAKKLPEHLKKFSKLTSDDNPVVVIAKLKK
jgi:hypothetical protein